MMQTRNPTYVFTTSFLSTTLLLATMVSTTNNASGDVKLVQEQGKVRVEIDGEHFTSYLFEGHRKPILYPVVGPHQIGMTRNYPMREGVVNEASDHPHHQSIWFTHGNVNGVDFWSIDEKAGRIVQDALVHAVGGEQQGSIKSTNRWIGPDESVVCTDTRELVFSVKNGARVIDWNVTIHASQGEVRFGDTKEGTMGIRTHPRLRLQNDPRRGVTSVAGHAVNSEGVSGADIWGKRARWVDYSGDIDGHIVGIAIFDHPSNPRHPSWWHARAYGLVAANPFGVHNFENKPEGTGDLTIPAGDSLTFRYRFVFHEGDAKQANVSRRYAEFAAPPLRDLDSYFPLLPAASVEAWDQRADEIRRRILVSVGLWPMPSDRPVRAEVHGRVERDDYTVEKVSLESYPGHFVTGNLYRPTGAAVGPRAAVLCPHGHWSQGRYHDIGESEIGKYIVQGSERFEVGGRHPIQARCVQLARMGCVVFNYDMAGYADSKQIPFEVIHSYKDSRPEFDTAENWGFYGVQAEMRMQSPMGLQTYNSLCALDFVCSLPDVDQERIAVTGASGGGTQTMILCAIDPRPAVSFPAVMVSTGMQGGCTCENASCLRVGTGNVEFAALFAPKPQGLTGADDWTREIETKGLPELKQLYTMLGAEDHVMARALTHFEHNYNHVSRAIMYQWLNRHLQLGLEEPILERDYQPLSKEEMCVWNDEHPQPPGGGEHERDVLRSMTQNNERQFAELVPCDKSSWNKFREVVGGAWQVLVGSDLPSADAVDGEVILQRDRGDYTETQRLLHDTETGDKSSAVFLHPTDWNGEIVIWVSGRGKHAILGENREPNRSIQRLLDGGVSVTAADVALQGEFVDEDASTEIRTVNINRDFAGYTYGYNPTLFAQRVRNILALVSYSLHDQRQPKKIVLVGAEGAGPWVAAARAIAGGVVDTAAVDTHGFRFGALRSWRDPQFLPGTVKYGDVPALLALNAPHPLWVAGKGQNLPELVAAS